MSKLLKYCDRLNGHTQEGFNSEIETFTSNLIRKQCTYSKASACCGRAWQDIIALSRNNTWSDDDQSSFGRWVCSSISKSTLNESCTHNKFDASSSYLLTTRPPRRSSDN